MYIYIYTHIYINIYIYIYGRTVYETSHIAKSHNGSICYNSVFDLGWVVRDIIFFLSLFLESLQPHHVALTALCAVNATWRPSLLYINKNGKQLKRSKNNLDQSIISQTIFEYIYIYIYIYICIYILWIYKCYS